LQAADGFPADSAPSEAAASPALSESSPVPVPTADAWLLGSAPHSLQAAGAWT